ncbi:hypothetical protein BDF21DRAFT_329678, partial [Thamnidium elegans]
FFYEDGQENIFNEKEKVYDPMEDILTYIGDPNLVLETITSRQNYLSVKRPPKKIVEGFSVKTQSKPSKLKPSMESYNSYSDFTRETFIDRMLENPQERGTGGQSCKRLKY